MGTQSESAREKGMRSARIAVLVMLLVRLIIDANISQMRKVEIAAQEAEAEAAQRAEAQRQREAVQAVLAQVADESASSFAPDVEVRTVDGVGQLTFSTPASWEEQERYGETHVFLEPDTYSGLFEAGVAPDLCSTSASADDAARYVQRDTLFRVGDASWSGKLGEALWYRYPIQTAGKRYTHPSYGFLEVILSGSDVYYLVALCKAEDYTAEVQDEMLSVLASANVPAEAPLLNDMAQHRAAMPEGTRLARDLAGEGTMADFLVSHGDFRIVEREGAGNDVVAIPRSIETLHHPSFCLITVTYEGTGRFVVRRVEEPGGEGAVLVDREGPYHGVITNLGDVEKTLQQDKLEVTAEGAWSFTFAPLADTPVVENGATYTGDALVFMDEDAVERVRCVHEGPGVFTVDAAGYSGNATLVDVTGPCDKTAAWDDPHTLFVVHAEGDWSLSW